MNTILENKVSNLFLNTKAKYLSTKTLFKGKFIDLIEEEYLLPNNVIMTRERIIKNKGKQAVIIIAITEDNKYILVSQNRINEMTTLEFPSGYIEKNENIIEASARELLEETGYTASYIEQIDSYYTQISIDSSIVNIVIAYNCGKTNEQNLGRYEYINYDKFTLEELKELIINNYITSVGNKLAFYELLYLSREKIDNKTKVLK